MFLKIMTERAAYHCLVVHWFSINEEHWSLRRNRRSFLRIITYYWLLILFINHNIILHNIKPPLGNSLVPVEAENKKVPLPPSLLQPWTKTLFLVIISKLLHHHGDFNKKPKSAFCEMYAKKDIFFRVE